jgi:hypothetical protein
VVNAPNGATEHFRRPELAESGMAAFELEIAEGCRRTKYAVVFLTEAPRPGGAARRWLRTSGNLPS